ncbi:MAG: thioredoxin family protein [Hyphomicrobiaceae bacterium]
MAAQAPLCNFGWKAPEFALPSTNGGQVSLSELKGDNGTLVAFICNHCPYVVAVIERLVRDASQLAPLGVATVAICSNDAVAYPADSFINMKEFSKRYEFPFSYLHDEDQTVAQAYKAVCTPDFFGFDANLGLQYRGRLDASRAQPGPPDLRRDLFEAMRQIVKTGEGPKDQFPSMGCSIKWREAA